MDIKKPFYPPVRGRGARTNPTGRFEKQQTEMDADAYDALCANDPEEAQTQIHTEVFNDHTKSIISTNDSPDVGIEASVNPYRGCEHGCIYCYARPTHEYLGMSAGTDFETKIFIKADAAVLLTKQLSARSWRPRIITLSGITDPYQPLEKKLEITRSCLAVLRNFANPALIITKNFLVTRDMDILKEMAAQNTIAVNLSITTLDAHLTRTMEPRTSRPDLRLKAIEMLSREGIPAGVMIGPVLPGLTDHEIPAILKAAADAGACYAGYTMLRLPHGVKDLFKDWLEHHYPDRAAKVLNRIRAVRGGKLYDSAFGTRMRGTGHYADHTAQMFALYKKRYGLNRPAKLSLEGFRKSGADGQLSLFQDAPQ